MITKLLLIWVLIHAVVSEECGDAVNASIDEKEHRDEPDIGDANCRSLLMKMPDEETLSEMFREYGMDDIIEKPSVVDILINVNDLFNLADARRQIMYAIDIAVLDKIGHTHDNEFLGVPLVFDLIVTVAGDLVVDTIIKDIPHATICWKSHLRERRRHV